MSALTKSLHTVTAVSRVAAYIAEINPLVTKPDVAVNRALRVLGYEHTELNKNDPTLLAAIAATKRLLG